MNLRALDRDRRRRLNPDLNPPSAGREDRNADRTRDHEFFAGLS
jgi:hypothetical protein